MYRISEPNDFTYIYRKNATERKIAKEALVNSAMDTLVRKGDTLVTGVTKQVNRRPSEER